MVLKQSISLDHKPMLTLQTRFPLSPPSFSCQWLRQRMSWLQMAFIHPFPPTVSGWDGECAGWAAPVEFGRLWIAFLHPLLSTVGGWDRECAAWTALKLRFMETLGHSTKFFWLSPPGCESLFSILLFSPSTDETEDVKCTHSKHTLCGWVWLRVCVKTLRLKLSPFDLNLHGSFKWNLLWGWRQWGLGLIHIHVNPDLESTHSPALRVLLRVVALLLYGQMDGPSDQQVVHSADSNSTSEVWWSPGDHSRLWLSSPRFQNSW